MYVKLSQYERKIVCNLLRFPLFVKILRGPCLFLVLFVDIIYICIYIYILYIYIYIFTCTYTCLQCFHIHLHRLYIYIYIQLQGHIFTHIHVHNFHIYTDTRVFTHKENAKKNVTCIHEYIHHYLPTCVYIDRYKHTENLFGLGLLNHRNHGLAHIGTPKKFPPWSEEYSEPPAFLPFLDKADNGVSRDTWWF